MSTAWTSYPPLFQPTDHSLQTSTQLTTWVQPATTFMRLPARKGQIGSLAFGACPAKQAAAGSTPLCSHTSLTKQPLHCVIITWMLHAIPACSTTERVCCRQQSAGNLLTSPCLIWRAASRGSCHSHVVHLQQQLRAEERESIEEDEHNGPRHPACSSGVSTRRSGNRCVSRNAATCCAQRDTAPSGGDAPRAAMALGRASLQDA